MREVKGQTTHRFSMMVSGVIHEPRIVTSDVQANPEKYGAPSMYVHYKRVQFAGHIDRNFGCV